MATNFFMKIAEIPGESTDQNHKKEFEIMSFSHGVSQPTSSSRSTAGGATVERCFHQDFSVTKYIDIGTPDLNLFCCQGKPLKKITVTCYRADAAGEKAVDYMEYTLEDAIVSSISIGGGGGDMPTESITFNYAKIKWNYIPQKEGGGAKEGNKTAGWDLFTNKKV